jgi:anti-sigma regulatory factor (Ser/Thr protein kinase)
MLLPIVTMTIETESDVVAVRQRARRVAELLGFERQDQTRIATAVSEIARDAFLYAGGGRVEFVVEIKSSQLFRIRISDRGKGTANLQAILDGQYRSQSGMGLGLVGARCLLDRFDVNSNPDEVTTVDLGQHLPERRNRLTQAKLSEIATALKREDAVDPLAAPRDQNRELIQSLEEHDSGSGCDVARGECRIEGAAASGHAADLQKRDLAREVSLFLRDAVGSQVFP